MPHRFQVGPSRGQAFVLESPQAESGYNRGMRGDPYAGEAAGARWAVAAAVVLALVGFVLFGGGAVTRALGLGGPPSARLEAQAPGAVTRSESSAVPALQAYAEPAEATRDLQKTMPADVRAWLEHLERIERRRQGMATDQVAGALVSLASIQGAGGAAAMLEGLLGGDATAPDPEPPSVSLGKDAASWRAEWARLQEEFQSVAPPAVCVPVRNAYARALDGTAAMISEVVAQVENSAQDPKAAVAALSRLRGTSASRIDVAAAEADRGVGDVCSQYDTPKWFSIQPDVGGGALDRIGGL